MTQKIKRSMAVHPAPVVVEEGKARRALNTEYRGTNYGEKTMEWHGVWGFEITRVTNSVDYMPGAYLTKEQVQALIGDDWTISVIKS